MKTILAELRDLAREVRGAASLDEALAVVVRRIERSKSADACAVYMTDVEADRYVLKASSGLDAAATEAVHLDRRAGLLGLVGDRREVILLEGAPAHARRSSSGSGGTGVDTFLGVPLIHYHRVLGVLAAWKEGRARFDEREVAWFVTIAAQLARLIHEAAALEEVTRLVHGEGPEDAFIQGVPAAAGLAIGTAALVHPLDDLESVPDRRVEDVDREETDFRAAVAAARDGFRASGERLGETLPKEVRDLFEAYAMLLGSDTLVLETIEGIRAGKSAPTAWRDTIKRHVRVFDEMEDPYLRARGEDVRSLGEEVLSQLRSGWGEARAYPDRCVLVGPTVSVAEIAAVPAGRLAGIVCTHGSASSHTAVLARALEVPVVVSLPALPIGHLEGSTIVVDGDLGRIYVRPSPAALDRFDRRIVEAKESAGRLEALRDQPAQTPDGVRLPLYANVGLALDVEAARRVGAEGVGLCRTEYQFLLRESFPSEEEQFHVYRLLLEAFAPSPVTVRTLDVGGDKVLPYFPVQEENPFLGCRGIRFSLEHPEIFLTQIRALLRANAGLENLQVLFPMIARVGELDEALELLGRAHRELSEEGRAVANVKVGAMIEIPSAVFLARSLADRVDFLSVGTNDLAQYLLAADRTNAQVATPYDAVHPAVLDAIVKVVDAAHERGTPVTACGEMAGDPAGALLLLGMGIDGLSMSPACLPRVKLAIRTFTAEHARSFLDRALREEDGLAVHRLLNAALEKAAI